MKSVCSVLVNSCDQYAEVWHPFFTLFKKYWADCPYPLYLNTETLACGIEGVTTLIPKEGTPMSWSDRLLCAVKAIESDYILLFLDDFFLMGNVNREEVAEKISIMEREKDIAVFYFKHSTGQTSDVCEYGDYIAMDTSKNTF